MNRNKLEHSGITGIKVPAKRMEISGKKWKPRWIAAFYGPLAYFSSFLPILAKFWADLSKIFLFSFWVLLRNNFENFAFPDTKVFVSIFVVLDQQIPFFLELVIGSGPYHLPQYQPASHVSLLVFQFFLLLFGDLIWNIPVLLYNFPEFSGYSGISAELTRKSSTPLFFFHFSTPVCFNCHSHFSVDPPRKLKLDDYFQRGCGLSNIYFWNPLPTSTSPRVVDSALPMPYALITINLFNLFNRTCVSYKMPTRRRNSRSQFIPHPKELPRLKTSEVNTFWIADGLSGFQLHYFPAEWIPARLLHHQLPLGEVAPGAGLAPDLLGKPPKPPFCEVLWTHTQAPWPPPGEVGDRPHTTHLPPAHPPFLLPGVELMERMLRATLALPLDS